MKNRENKKAFTLAETLITLTILGVVAAITVPSLINKYIESSNRTKVKKAMAAYEKALNQMIIENDLKGSVGAVKAWADTETDCALTTVYFKKILGSGCIFQTADKVWWDISDIEHPVISLKDEITTAKRDDFKNAAKSSDNNDVFGLVGYIDNGVVRINDKGAATAGTDDATLLNKTYAFMNNESATTPKTNTDKLADCATGSAATCKVTYDCPTQEEPTKTCDLEMTKQTFTNTCISLYDDDLQSCPVKSGTNYVAMVKSKISWNDAQTACPEGTHMAKAAELMQLSNSEEGGNALISLFDNKCSNTGNNYCGFLAAEDSQKYDGYGYAFFTDTVKLQMLTKQDKNSYTRLVCVSN